MPEPPISAMPERLPDIPYSGNPVYGGARRIRLRERLFALARLAQMSGYVGAVAARQAFERRPWVEKGPTPFLKALLDDGVTPVRLSARQRSDIAEAARPYFDRLEARRATMPDGSRGYCDNQLDTTPDVAPDLFRALDAVLGESGVMASTRAYLGCAARARKATMQINDAHDTYWRAHFENVGATPPATAFMHVDNTFGVVKAIIYLSEVDEKSGPFAYVPGTHRIKVGWFEAIVLRAADIWLDVYPGEKCYFPALPKWARRKAKFGDDIEPDSAFAKWLLAREKVITSRDGDLMLFDVKGIHRGGMVEQGDRRVIQVMMR